MTPVERLLAKLPGAKPAGKGWSARCPAHEDRRASLSIAEGEDGRALVKCHAGCQADAICAAVGLRVLDLMPGADTLPTPNKAHGNGKATAGPASSPRMTIETKTANCCSKWCAMNRRRFGNGGPSPAAAGNGRSKGCEWFRIAFMNIGPSRRGSWQWPKAKRIATTWPASECWQLATPAAREVDGRAFGLSARPTGNRAARQRRSGAQLRPASRPITSRDRGIGADR